MPKSPQLVCRRCLGRTDICGHTKAGRALLASRRTPLLPHVGDLTDPAIEASASPDTLPSQPFVFPPPGQPVTPPRPSLFNFPSSPSTTTSSSSSTLSFSSISSSSECSDSPGSSPLNNLVSNQREEVPIDPFLLTTPAAPPNTPASPPTGQEDFIPPLTPSTVETPPTEASTNAPAGRHRRARVTDGRFGYVDGCMRGNQPYVIPRPRELRAIETDSKKATKRFRRVLVSILAQCEMLAIETGCWILVGAQHANANHAAIHYASPKLRAEALADTKSLSSKFAKVTNALISTRRSDAMVLAKQLQDLETARDEAVQEVDSVRSDLARERARVTAMAAMLTKLGGAVPEEYAESANDT